MTALLALDFLRSGDVDQALQVLETVAERDSDWHAVRGKILLAEGRPAEARDALALAVSLGDASAETILNLALAEEGAGNRGRAQGLIRALIPRVPEWDEPWVRLADSLRRDEDWDEAATAYAEALERDPSHMQALLGAAALRIRVGDGASAQRFLLRCLGHDADCAEAWDALGQALMLTHDARQAEAAFAEAQRREGHNFYYALNRARAAQAAGNAEVELARLEVAALEDPVNPTLPMARAVLLEQMSRRAEAIDALEVAVTLAPEAPMPAILLGEILARTARGPEAIKALRRALVLKPGDRRLTNNLGAVLMRQHQHAEAARILGDLRATAGDDPVCLCNLANVTALLGEQDAALRIAREAIALAPDAALPYRALANVMPYHPATKAMELLAALRAISDRLPREAAILRNIPDPGRRLRVGLLSGSLRTHPVGWLTVAAFENLDPAMFEIHCFAQNASHDPIARRFRAITSGWHDIDLMDDAVLAEFVRAQGIDILIDLGGYGDAGRMAACARRLAPVQVKWVGMQNHSTGLAEMDWFITDRWETPGSMQSLYSERLLCLPDGYVCYSPPGHGPDIVPPPACTAGGVTFGCFNNLAKITPEVIGTWAEILHRIPDARLILKTHQFSHAGTRAAIAAQFVSLGVVEARLALRGASPHREFLRQYGDIDIVLDPFPYTGGLTTCEALWMGVPTITLVGEIFAARHSFSHLSNVGLADWAAFNRDDYIRLACEKARDVPALSALRAGLRARVKASPLCDASRFGRNLGAALRHAWAGWCAQP